MYFTLAEIGWSRTFHFFYFALITTETDRNNCRSLFSIGFMDSKWSFDLFWLHVKGN